MVDSLVHRRTVDPVGEAVWAEMTKLADAWSTLYQHLVPFEAEADAAVRQPFQPVGQQLSYAMIEVRHLIQLRRRELGLE